MFQAETELNRMKVRYGSVGKGKCLGFLKEQCVVFYCFRMRLGLFDNGLGKNMFSPGHVHRGVYL